MQVTNNENTVIVILELLCTVFVAKSCLKLNFLSFSKHP